MSADTFDSLVQSTHRLAKLVGEKHHATDAQVMLTSLGVGPWNASVYLGKGCTLDIADVALHPSQAVANLHDKLLKKLAGADGEKFACVEEAKRLAELFPAKLPSEGGIGDMKAAVEVERIQDLMDSRRK